MVNGYYEWDDVTNPNSLKPFLFYRENIEGGENSDDYLYLACLYNNAFSNSIGGEYNHFVVLTVNASKNLAHIHDRMPVFLDEYTKELWLDPTLSFATCFEEIMKSKVYEGISFFEVGDIVNSIKYDVEDCILPRKEYEEKLHKKGLGKYFSTVDKPEGYINN